MKKRFWMLLLAGLLALSATSCITANNETETTGAETTAAAETADTEQTFLSADEQVYTVFSPVSLRQKPSDDSPAVRQVPVLTKLHRIKYNSVWSGVEYDGGVYYLPSAALTTDDLEGLNFTSVTPITMYATQDVNVRTRPSSNNDVSPTQGELHLNDTVTVTGTGNGWSRISVEGSTLYVFSKYPSTEKVPTVEDLGNYESLFTDLDTPEIMFATLPVSVRKYPSREDFSPNVLTVEKGATVKVVARGTVQGRDWSEIKVVNEDPSAPANYYFVSSDCLSPVWGAVSTKTEMLAFYTAFTPLDTEKTMYAVNSTSPMHIRETPRVEDESYSNKLMTKAVPSTPVTFSSKAEITVVAKGTADDADWYMIKYDNGFYFVSADLLTPNATGEPVLQLADVLAKYAGISAVPEVQKTIQQTLHYYASPSIQYGELGSFQKNDVVTVVASGSQNNSRWYVIKNTRDGGVWFISNDSDFVK